MIWPLIRKRSFEVMMNLYRPNNRAGPRRRLMAVTALVVVIFILDLVTGGIIRRNVRSLAIPVIRISTGMWTTVFANGFFSSRATLQKTIQSQREEIARLQEAAATYNLMKQENDQLRTLVAIAERSPGITAPIISSFTLSP